MHSVRILGSSTSKGDLPIKCDDDGNLVIQLEAATVNVGDVDVVSSALPTGAATSAKQDSLIAKFPDQSGGKVPVVMTSEADIATMQDDIALIKADVATLKGAISGSEAQVDVVSLPANLPDTSGGDFAGAHSGIDSIDGKLAKGDQPKASSLSVTPATDITDGRYIGDIKFGEELPAGAQFVGRSGVKAFKFLQSFTRLNSATPYSAGDAVNNSDSAPAILSQDLSSFGAALGQFLAITNVQIVLSIKNTTANLQAYIFNQTFAATNDNSELSIDDATAACGGHVIAMPNNYSTALNTKLQSDPGQYVMQLAASGTPSLYVALQTPSGYTPSNSAVYTLIIDGYLL